MTTDNTEKTDQRPENIGQPRGDIEVAVCDECGEQPKLVIRDGYAPYLKCNCGYSDVDRYGTPDVWVD